MLVPASPIAIPSVKALLENRGLDRVRTYPGPVTAPAVVIGARRVSITDISPAGRMPMGDGSGWREEMLH